MKSSELKRSELKGSIYDADDPSMKNFHRHDDSNKHINHSSSLLLVCRVAFKASASD